MNVDYTQKAINKAQILIEALPYIKNFSKKIVVVKYGGSVFDDDEVKDSIIRNICLMQLVGIKPVIVHGGGNEINKFLNKINIVSKFIDGQRVTDKKSIDMVEMVLSGKVNKNIVAEINKNGVDAIGISGKDSSLLVVEKKMNKNNDLGYVGKVTDVNVGIIKTLLDGNFLPVISPIGISKNGETFNVNADNAALSIAQALDAEKLVFLSNVEGVLLDKNNSNSRISYISVDEIDKYINDGVISDGMIPKIESSKDAIKNGVKTVHILDGRLKNSILLEVFTDKGIGTMIGK